MALQNIIDASKDNFASIKGDSIPPNPQVDSLQLKYFQVSVNLPGSKECSISFEPNRHTKTEHYQIVMGERWVYSCTMLSSPDRNSAMDAYEAMLRLVTAAIKWDYRTDSNFDTTPGRSKRAIFTDSNGPAKSTTSGSGTEYPSTVEVLVQTFRNSTLSVCVAAPCRVDSIRK